MAATAAAAVAFAMKLRRVIGMIFYLLPRAWFSIAGRPALIRPSPRAATDRQGD